MLSPVSGGGLLSGTATAVKLLRPEAKVFGVEPELAADTAESFRTGKIVTWPAELTSRTIADGLRTQSVGERNFAHIQAYVDGIITVTEAEIRAAMRAIVATARLVPEPSGAVTTAALLFHAARLPPYRKAVAIVSGGNVDPAMLAEVLTESVVGSTIFVPSCSRRVRPVVNYDSVDEEPHVSDRRILGLSLALGRRCRALPRTKAEKDNIQKPMAGPRATALRVTWLYVSPDQGAQKVDRVQPGARWWWRKRAARGSASTPTPISRR